MLDWMEAAEVLKKYWYNSPQVDDGHSAEEGTTGLISTNAENLFIVCPGIGLCARVELLNAQTFLVDSHFNWHYFCKLLN